MGLRRQNLGCIEVSVVTEPRSPPVSIILPCSSQKSPCTVQARLKSSWELLSIRQAAHVVHLPLKHRPHRWIAHSRHWRHAHPLSEVGLRWSILGVCNESFSQRYICACARDDDRSEKKAIHSQDAARTSATTASSHRHIETYASASSVPCPVASAQGRLRSLGSSFSSSSPTRRPWTSSSSSGYHRRCSLRRECAYACASSRVKPLCWCPSSWTSWTSAAGPELVVGSRKRRRMQTKTLPQSSPHHHWHLQPQRWHLAVHSRHHQSHL